MTTVKLSKPITAHGETIYELTFREPTVKDLAELGYPFKIVSAGNGAGVELLPKAILAYAARLAAVNPASMEFLSLSDYSRIQARFSVFSGTSWRRLRRLFSRDRSRLRSRLFLAAGP